MTLKSLFATFCIVVLFICLPSMGWAQPGGPGGDPDPQVPLDGGVSLLVAAGVGYALKKAHDKRKENKLAAEEER
ncbi:MAG: hypothetical protein INR73_15540 [Williamsia sp.]|nr:hypothetical protein [Williamsia sp.]